jgi:hypothetical protein
MKKFLILLLSSGVIAAAAPAKGFDRYPAIQINGKFYTIDCLCVDGDTLRHKESTRNIARPIVKEERFCKKWDSNPENGGNCLEWLSMEKACPLTYTVKKLYTDGETEYVLGMEFYTIPACDDR